MERLRAPTIPAAVGLPDPFLRRQPDHFPHHLLTYTHTHAPPARQFRQLLRRLSPATTFEVYSGPGFVQVPSTAHSDHRRRTGQSFRGMSGLCLSVFLVYY